MGYKCESIDVEDAKTGVQEYEYALIYSISEKKLIPVDRVTDTDLDECIDARFFSVSGELHIFTENDTLKS